LRPARVSRRLVANPRFIDNNNDIDISVSDFALGHQLQDPSTQASRAGFQTGISSLEA
jgi:hypothetical protein